MTHVYNAERGFKDEFLDGLTAAYGRYLQRVPNASAVMAVDAPIAGEVSVIIGGGSGHYPAFAGLVGPGGCHGAVVGDVFTSPSAEQAYRAIRALDGGAGVLLSFGNYSGDVMQFDLAAERARADGTDIRIVLVTDDVVSAPRQRTQDRRGIAGGFWVFRAAASAARRGDPLDAVERIARLANSRTFTFGVAFDGCTFPGRAQPLFTVERGRMALGLGIHGEPGIDLVDWMPAARLADVLVDQVLPERPDGAVRARVLLNGLGATKYEELFVLYGSVAARLAAEGVELVDPEVGEFVTSLDMAGCSLTLCWLTDELEPLLSAAMAAPGFRSGATTVAGRVPDRSRRIMAPTDESAASSGAVDAERAAADPAARVVRAAFEAMARAVDDEEAELGRLDSIAGDGDHGAGMSRGMRAAANAGASAGPGAPDVLQAAGVAFGDAAGGASGALWGSGLLAAARALRGYGTLDTPAIASAVEAARDAVVRLGGAAPGDKTLLDALVPFQESLRASGSAPLADAWRPAAAAATSAARETAQLPGRKGRAATHGVQSIGTPDPGATSLALVLNAASDAIDRGCPGDQR